MKRKRIVLALSLAFAGCATTFRLKRPSVAMDVWIKQSESELIEKWGPPQSTTSDGKGGKIFIYTGSKTTTTDDGGYELNGIYYDSDPVTTTFSYRNLFYADAKGEIYSWKWSNSEGDGEDYGSFVSNVRQRAGKGDASAARWLGFWYSNGANGLAQDYQEAMRWDQVAAARGLDDAQNNLGLCYFLAPGLQDYDKAFYWFKKSAAQGYAPGEFDLGQCYKDGKGVAKDLKKARLWLQKAAKQGNDGARAALADLNRAP